MAKKKEKNPLVRDNWLSNFNLVGKAVITDHTFKIDEHSEKSAWVYNSLSLGVDCGEKFGTVFAEMMGGYSDERENVIYAHGKNKDGSDDFKNRIEVAWEDRFNPDVLDQIGELCFITIGLEKTDKGKTYYKKFLSSYDAIAYVQEHLENGMVIRVKGSLKYSVYQENTQVRKTITSIALSGADDESKYAAHFTQTMLLDKDSANLKDIDKEKGVLYVNARVLDYVKEMNGVDISGQYPFTKTFEYEFPDLKNGEDCKRKYNTLFKVKKGVTQITFDGDFVENGAMVTLTYNDLPDEIKELIDCGVFTEEQAIARCSSNNSRERRMVLRFPNVKLVGEEKTPILQKIEEKYDEEDLIFDIPEDTATYDEINSDDNLPFDLEGVDRDDSDEEEKPDGDENLDWLADL
jgi:hypothetical protein